MKINCQQKARRERSDKLKNARKEAQEELNSYRGQKQGELDKQNAALRSGDDSGEKLQQETTEKVKELEKQFNENKDSVIQLLLDKISDVDIDVPSAYKRRGASSR